MMRKRVDVLFQQFGPRKLTTDVGKGFSLGKKDHLNDFNNLKIKPD
jgi:hypothetical protein